MGARDGFNGSRPGEPTGIAGSGGDFAAGRTAPGAVRPTVPPLLSLDVTGKETWPLPQAGHGATY